MGHSPVRHSVVSSACIILLSLLGMGAVPVPKSVDDPLRPVDARLALAVEYDNPQAVSEALGNGADVYLSTRQDGTLLHLTGSPAVADILLAKGLDINARTERGRTPLLSAVRQMNSPMVRFYLEHGADPDLLETESPQPLIHLAAAREDLATVELLLEFGQSAKCVDEHLITPLHLAAREGSAEVVARLLAAGADPNALTDNLATPVHVAKSTEVLALLLKAGGSADVRNAAGVTPLHIAVAEERPDVAALLLEAGADPFARLDDGSSVSDLLDTKQLALFRLLAEYGAVAPYSTGEIQ